MRFAQSLIPVRPQAIPLAHKECEAISSVVILVIQLVFSHNLKSMAKTPLREFAANKYSQNGEDGIISEILKRISENHPLDKWCVEFGAWDGVYLSNTCKLLREDNYRGVLIEGDPSKVVELNRNFPSPEIIKICTMIGFTQNNSLDTILKQTSIPSDFDFLSIDIDGNDYHVFESLAKYHPKVVCIEFNPTIPIDVNFVQSKDFKIKQGASPKSIDYLAKSKGYTTVTATSCNLILVRNDLVNCVIDAETSLDSIFKEVPLPNPTYIFVGYDGTILSNKESITLPWHGGISIKFDELQVLPKNLRAFYPDYSVKQKLLFLMGRGRKNFKDKFKNIITNFLKNLRTKEHDF